VTSDLIEQHSPFAPPLRIAPSRPMPTPTSCESVQRTQTADRLAAARAALADGATVLPFSIGPNTTAEDTALILHIAHEVERLHGGRCSPAFQRDKDGRVRAVVIHYRPAVAPVADRERAAAIREEVERAHADAELWGAC
jgi:hypothetical protein